MVKYTFAFVAKVHTRLLLNVSIGWDPRKRCYNISNLLEQTDTPLGQHRIIFLVDQAICRSFHEQVLP